MPKKKQKTSFIIPETSSKLFLISLVFLIVVTVSFLIASLFANNKKNSTEESSVAINQQPTITPDYNKVNDDCTIGPSHSPPVKYCWDNSEVHPVAPNCDQYENCPALPPVSEWETYNDIKSGFSIKYPFEITPQPNDQTGQVYLLNGCVSAVSKQKDSINYSDKDIFIRLISSPEYKDQKIGETITFTQQSDDSGSQSKLTYTRLSDRKIAGKMWKSYQWGSTWEMYSAVTLYVYSDATRYYFLNEGDGGACPNGVATKLIDTFQFVK